MTLQPIWHKRKHALNSALDHSGEITDAQHGTKTTIPDAHHPKLHQISHCLGGDDEMLHRHQMGLGQNYVDTEVSTASLTYVELINFAYYPYTPTCFGNVFFSHNVKNMGTISARGTGFKITVQREEPTVGAELTLGEYRWTDGLADYKCMTIAEIQRWPIGATKARFRIYWKVDDANYACWSKTRRFLFIEEWTSTTPVPP